MTVAVRMEFAEGTTAQYDRINELMGQVPRGAGPAGLLFHWAAAQGAGFLVTDVWKDRDRFDEFSRTEIGPYSQQVGITTPPKTTLYEVHNYLTGGELADTSTPIAVVMEFDGDLTQYDEVIDMMGYTPAGPGAPGGIFHWAAATDNGVQVTDVWQDRQTFEAFAEHEMQPYTAKAGVAAPTSTTLYEVYNYLTAGP